MDSLSPSGKPILRPGTFLNDEDDVFHLKVFISGLRGLGLEIAKNLILSGVEKIIVQDDEQLKISDLGSNFLCKEEDVGKKTRGQASISELRSLNPSVEVDIYESEITQDFLSGFDVVVFTDYYDKKRIIEFNKICRERQKPIGFIYGGCLGLYGFVFVDFGQNFWVLDTREEEKQIIISRILNENPTTLMTHNKHGLADGDHVIFADIEGMDELNGKEFVVKVKSLDSFTIDYDSTNFGHCVNCGYAKNVALAQQVTFKSFEESLEAPLSGNDMSFPNPDMTKEGRPEQLHIIINAILEFYDSHQMLPRLLNQEDEDEIVRICEKINMKSSENKERIKVDKVDEDLVRNIAKFARTQVSPHASFFGGIIAQEVLKYTGKFMPLRQWLHYENFEVLPEDHVNREICNSRYHDQIILFGQEFQESLMDKRIFLFGAGGLGCEFIKQFALTGLCCGSKGELICSDFNRVRKPNFKTQLLYKREDLGQFKSNVAIQAGKRINSDLNVKPLELKTDWKNDLSSDDVFWESKDAVVSATDSLMARLFLDSHCVKHDKYFFDSGTWGTKCSSQIIIPYQSQTYSDSSDPQEETAYIYGPKRNFPYQIEHIIQYAKDSFEDIFVNPPKELQKYKQDPAKYIKELQNAPNYERKNKLESIIKLLERMEEVTQIQCIKVARQLFEDIFYNQIDRILQNFPPDHKTESGLPFWEGKKCPRLINFEPLNDTHKDFIFSVANLMAYIFNLTPINDRELISKVCSIFEPKRFEQKRENFIKATSAEAENNEDFEISKMVDFLTNVKLSNYSTINCIESDQRDDLQIRFIYTTANIRAQNYRFGKISRTKVSGENPSLVSTFAMTAGVVGFEIYKFVAEKKLEVMQNSFCNLALPLWIFSKPLPPTENKDKEYDPIMLGPVKVIPAGELFRENSLKFEIGMTSWTKIHIQGPMTILELIQHFRLKYGINLMIIQIEQIMLYNCYTGRQLSEISKLNLIEAYTQKTGKQIPSSKKALFLTVSAETLEDNIDVLLPTIKYII